MDSMDREEDGSKLGLHLDSLSASAAVFLTLAARADVKDAIEIEIENAEKERRSRQLFYLNPPTLTTTTTTTAATGNTQSESEWQTHNNNTDEVKVTPTSPSQSRNNNNSFNCQTQINNNFDSNFTNTNTNSKGKNLSANKAPASKNQLSQQSGDRNQVEKFELVQDISSRMILHWNYRNLSEFPQELLDHGHHVREIYLKRNSIIHVPKDVGKLENLTNIYLSGNQLCTLSDEIGQLTNLEVLDVSQNFLKTLPRSIGNLRKLQTLVLTHNQLVFLPSEMKNLRNLQFLELSDNQLRNGSLSEEIIHGLEALQELCIDGNPIKSLPRNLSSSPNLSTVSACKCDLRFLPGLPFYSLIHGNGNHHRRSTNNNNNPVNYSEEDELNFQFRFDGNPNLNYIPYWMLQFFGPHLESFGSGGGTMEGEGASNEFETIRIVDLPHIAYTWESQLGRLKQLNKIHFYFDASIRNIQIRSSAVVNYHSSSTSNHTNNSNNNDCLSLLEICLRNLHLNREFNSSNSQRENELFTELPTHLLKLLIIGPCCQCFECMTPIFTVEWPLIFKLQTLGGVPVEASELLYPRHGVINAYNHFQLNERIRTGQVQGFHYGVIYFCNFRCKQRFIQTITSSNFLPFHDFKLIIQNEI